MRTKRRISGGALAIGAISIASLAAIMFWATTAAPSPVRVFRGHTGVVSSLAWSPDGKRIASGSWDETVRVWDVATGETERILTGSRQEVNGIAYAPDGARIAVGSGGGVGAVWNAQTGAPIAPGFRHLKVVDQVAYAPSGAYLASSGGGDRAVKLWDAQTLRLIRVLAGHKGWVGPFALSPNGINIATADQTTIRIWDATTGRIVHTLKNGGSYVNSLTFSPNGETLISVNRDVASAWNAKTGALTFTFGGNRTRFACFAPDGRTLATSTDFEVQLRRPRTGALERTIVRLPRRITPSRYPLLTTWLPRWFPPPRFATYHERIHVVEWSPDGKTIAYATGNNVYLTTVP